MKKILHIFLLFCLFSISKAQPYGNEWIKYGEKYYKFKVGTTSLYRINYSTLSTLGIPTSQLLGSDFKLFRNGNEVPLFVTSNGQFGAGDFIEFYGEKNDGKPDSLLYKNPLDQPTTLASLFSDTATFYLTIDPFSINLRITQQTNDVINVPTAEPYCYFTQKLFGSGLNVGTTVSPYYPQIYNSDFDAGEGIVYKLIEEPSYLYFLAPKYVYRDANTNAYLSSSVFLPSTNLGNFHKLNVSLGTFDSTELLYGPQVKHSIYTVNSLNISENSALFRYREMNTALGNVDILCKAALQYPRLFNADNQSKFNFEIKKSNEVYFEFKNYNNLGSIPILYDLKNKQRYLGVVDSVLKFHLISTFNEKDDLYLSSQSTSDILTVGSITTTIFNNFPQGDYLIISNKKLKNSIDGTDFIKKYSDYRSSVAGGNYNPATYFIDEIYDQFGFGINQNPLAIRNFLNYAIDKFTTKPKMVFIIGQGFQYPDNFRNQSKKERSLVPTYGLPASDNLLTIRSAVQNIPQLAIGRLAAIKGDDIKPYLDKVKEYEANLNDTFNLSETPFNKLWMKNVLHLGGGNNSFEQQQFRYFLDNYKATIEAPKYGGRVSSLFKNSTDPIQIAQNIFLDSLINTGVSLITFFGHSATSTLDFNLVPENFDNAGKYHLMLSNGCFVGSIFNDSYINGKSYSERFVLTPNKAAIGYIAPITYAVASNLNSYSTEFYSRFSNTMYNEPIGEILKETSKQMIINGGLIDPSVGEQMIFHGDPGLRINSHYRPDYYIDASSISFSPQNINASADSFLVKVVVKNLGAAVNDFYVVNIDRIFPNGQIQVTQVRLPSARSIDTVLIWIKSDRINGPGLNTFKIKVDYENTIAEYSELNNEVTVTKLILADDIIPIFPYEFCMVNDPNFQLVFSTASAFATPKTYIFQIDTTEFFNSPLLTQVKVTEPGATIKWKPSIPLVQNKVYYWRGTVDTTISEPANWKNSSFLYNTSLSTGWNQSHYFQYLKNSYNTLSLKNDRMFYYPNTTREIRVDVGYPFPLDNNIEAFLDGYLIGRNAWARRGFIFFVYDANTGQNYQTYQIGNTCTGPYNDVTCNRYPTNVIEFATQDNNPATGKTLRKNAADFLNSIPCNAYVLGYSFYNAGYTEWAADSVNTDDANLFQAFENLGVSSIRQQQQYTSFAFFLQRCNPLYNPIQIKRDGVIDTTFTFSGTWTKGTMESPIIGPAKDWKNFNMDWHAREAGAGDSTYVNLYGYDTVGIRTLLRNDLVRNAITPISIDAKRYPFLQMEWKTSDDNFGTAPQMDFWRLYYDKAPEAVVNPTIFFSKTRDTIVSGENFNMQVAVENVTPIDMDSLLVRFIIKDPSNNVTIIYKRFAPLLGNKNYNISFDYTFAGFNFFGLNYITVEVNPDDDQPEQFHFNNFAEFTLFVDKDRINPLLDVTFDGRHITDGEYVSANPEILFRLKDENKYLVLNDSSEFLIFMIYPSDPLNPVQITNTQTNVTYLPATSTNNGKNNEARLIYKPTLTDGTYEVRAQGIDRSKNDAGKYDYRIKFKVDSKPSITNILNYPNPFSTSTQFVFTLTGAAIPEQIIIQIFSATGKVVKEITRDQLGSLHIGTNVTDYRWDGTDNFGDRLANGVYFYRVLTRNLDGTSTEVKQTSIDKYFKKGYGKLYIIR